MNKVLGLLGLATRARKTVLGEELVLKAMAKEQQGIVFLASDAGSNITKKIQNKAKTYQYSVINNYTSNEISSAIGKKNRMLVLVSEQGFVKKFKEYLTS